MNRKKSITDMGVAVLLAPCVAVLRVGAVVAKYGQALVVVTGELVNVVNYNAR